MKMLDSVFEIHTEGDMEKMENRVRELSLSKQGRCALLRSNEYQQLRLAALYGRRYDKPDTLTVYGGVIKLVLDNNYVYVFYDFDLTDIDASVRKRKNSE